VRLRIAFISPDILSPKSIDHLLHEQEWGLLTSLVSLYILEVAKNENGKR